jgi:hypothetical protein
MSRYGENEAKEPLTCFPRCQTATMRSAPVIAPPVSSRHALIGRALDKAPARP